MHAAHEALMIGGALGVIAILAGLASTRIGTPLLLVFLVLGMLAGEDGPGGIVFNDFGLTYLLGSIALAVILFEGGQKTSFAMVRLGFWPATAMATAGVAVSAGLIAAVIVLTTGMDWTTAWLLGALVAPTDAAAVISVLRASKVAVPHKVLSILELESGLNDPAAVFLTVMLTEAIVHPGSQDAASGAILLVREMGGGAVIGLLGGSLMVMALRHLTLERSVYPVLMLACALAVFGAGQLLECSGFLAVYLAGVLVGNRGGERAVVVERGFEAFAWIAQVGLFLGLGLLVNPHEMVPFLKPAIVVAVVLIFVARPVAAILCLRPFGVSWRGTGFIAWVGLRGAVPIYLAMIPVLEGLTGGVAAFSLVFVIVLVSLVVQGWTVGPVARLLRLSSDEAGPRSDLAP